MPTEKLTFPGSLGANLAARLDRPEGRARAFAIFAHCFTCSKDVVAASRISRELASHGIAVLRFDFTGLGGSEGEFANTSFSSNVRDLVKAADFLRERFEAPQLLIGHSLGGTAVLAAAGDIPEVRAVASINAPAHAEHVTELFSSDIATIESAGSANVSLAGRPFTIRKDFLDDVRGTRLADRVAGLKRALMVLHAPTDDIVGIENAAEIYGWARHPKSFISLDGADHLLSRPEDAGFVAGILASWATRYVAPEGASEPASDSKAGSFDGVHVRESGSGTFQQDVIAGRHHLTADEPVSVGGLDSGPNPYDFLAVALGACTSMTLRMYVARKGWQLGRITVDVTHAKVHAADCAECEGRDGRVDRFERVISVDGEVTPEVSAKLIEIAGKCPVHRTLEQSSVVATRVRTAGEG